MSADYTGTVEQVYLAFADERYWLDRLAESGADEATLDSMDVDTDGDIAVVTTQVLYSNRLPGIVTQFHRGELRIVRRERWTAPSGERATARVSGNIPGAPVELDGDAVLAPGNPSGARLSLQGSVEVRVPLVGGKIEDFIRGQLSNLLLAEQGFTTQWLANNR